MEDPPLDVLLRAQRTRVRARAVSARASRADFKSRRVPRSAIHNVLFPGACAPPDALQATPAPRGPVELARAHKSPGDHGGAMGSAAHTRPKPGSHASG